MPGRIDFPTLLSRPSLDFQLIRMGEQAGNPVPANSND